MAFIKEKKRGKKYYYYVVFTEKENGKSSRRQLYAGSTRTQAEIKKKEMELGLLTGNLPEKTLPPSPTNQTTLGEHIDSFLSWGQGHLAKTTQANYGYALANFIEIVGSDSRLSTAASIHTLESYKSNRLKAVTPRTVRDELIILSSFFSYLMRFGIIEKNPMSKVKRPPKKNGAIDFLSRKEVKALVSLAANNSDPFFASRDSAIIETLVRTGLRATELCGLRSEDVDFKMRKIFVQQGKGGKSRVIPLSDKLAEILKDFPYDSEYVFTSKKGNQFNRHSLQLLFRRLQAKFPGGRRIYAHLLRHTFASLLAQDGVSIYKIQRYMGHSDVRTTTNAYAALSPESLQDDINRVDF